MFSLLRNVVSESEVAKVSSSESEVAKVSSIIKESSLFRWTYCHREACCVVRDIITLHRYRYRNQMESTLIRDWLVLLNFWHFFTWTGSLGATECELWIGNCQVQTPQNLALSIILQKNQKYSRRTETMTIELVSYCTKTVPCSGPDPFPCSVTIPLHAAWINWTD